MWIVMRSVRSKCAEFNFHPQIENAETMKIKQKCGWLIKMHQTCFWISWLFIRSVRLPWVRCMMGESQKSFCTWADAAALLCKQTQRNHIWHIKTCWLWPLLLHRRVKDSIEQYQYHIKHGIVMYQITAVDQDWIGKLFKTWLTLQKSY